MIDAVNKTRLLILAVSVFAIIGINTGFAQDRDTVWIWYGTPGDTAIQAEINDTLYVDVYVETAPNAYVADMLLALGANDNYIDTLVSESLGTLYYPFTEWQSAFFAKMKRFVTSLSIPADQL